MQPNLNEAAALALRRRRGLYQPRQAVRQAPEGRCGTRLARAGASDEGGPLKKSVIRIFGMTWQEARFAVDMAKTIGFSGEERHTRIIAMKISVTKIIWADLFNQAWLLRISGLFQSRPSVFIVIFKRPRPVHGQLYARSQSDNCLAAAGKRCRKWWRFRASIALVRGEQAVAPACG